MLNPDDYSRFMGNVEMPIFTRKMTIDDKDSFIYCNKS